MGAMVEGLVRALLDSNGVRTHSVTHRIKSEESVIRKLDAKGVQEIDLDEMHDLLGLRVITFFPDEVDRVAEIIKAQFEIDDANSVDKRSLLDPDRFGYLSLHYVASLNEARSGLDENARFSGRKFEVQIRSILQHAWAEIEHDLGYHTFSTIPDSVRRRFSRLAGLLEIADDEFERLRDDVADYQESVGEELTRSPGEVKINQDSIAALVSSNPFVTELDAELATLAGLQIDQHPGVPGIRAEELGLLGFQTVGEVINALTQRREALIAFLEEWLRRRSLTVAYRGMSLFFLGYIVLAERGSRRILAAHLEDIHMRDPEMEIDEIAAEVFEVFAHSRERLTSKPDP